MKTITTAFQTVNVIRERLDAEGLVELDMNVAWTLDASVEYYLLPYPSVFMAFTS